MSEPPRWENYPEVNWDDQGFRDWLANYWVLYDPKTFRHELTGDDFDNGLVQDIVRYPTWEKGVMAVRMYLAVSEHKLPSAIERIGQELAKFTFYEVFRNAGVLDEDCIGVIWKASLINGYPQGSTTVRW